MRREPDRAFRRRADALAKTKTRELLRRITPGLHTDPRVVGRWAAVHRRPCSCDGCQRQSNRAGLIAE